MPQSPATGIIRFGVFEVEPQTGILRKHGVRVRLQEQPFRVLLALLEKPGDVVTREELHAKVWAGTTFGDFDHSLNIAVNKIREALGDSAETPRFVETLPRRGYRFVVQVDGPAPGTPGLTRPQANRRILKTSTLLGSGFTVIALIALIVALFLRASPPELIWRRLTDDLRAKTPPILSDGSRLYFRGGALPDVFIAQLPLSGGELTRLPITLPGPWFDLLDITPDGQELLLGVYPGLWQYPKTHNPFWAVRTADRSSRRLGNLAGREASYSPDGRHIAFSAGGYGVPGTLSVARSDGSNARQLLEIEESDIVAPSWSPDGARIVFAQQRRTSEESSAWEIRMDGTRLKKLLPRWTAKHEPAAWTPDGRLLLLIRHFQLWAAPTTFRYFGSRGGSVFQLSSVEPRLSGPIRMRNNWILYVVGTTPLGELQRLDAHSKTWVSHMGGLSVEGVEYSRDRERVAYVTYPGGELWVRFADGAQPVQITRAPLLAYLPRWSPSGKLIAFLGRSTWEEPSRVYIVEAAGGNPRLACAGNSDAASDLTWAPDENSIVYASVTPTNQYLRVLNLATCEVNKFPGSDGLYSPRWSPDGLTLAALRPPAPDPKRRLLLYRVPTGKWEEAMPSNLVAWPFWSRDGRWLWGGAFNAILRYDTRLRRFEEVDTSMKVEHITGTGGSWFALTANDEPMILRRRDVQQIYAVELKPR